MAALGPQVPRGWGGGGGARNLYQTSVSRLANLSNNCQMVFPLLFRCKKLLKIAQGLSEVSQTEEAQFIQGAILNHTSWLLLSTLSLSRSGRQSLSLISLLTFLTVLCKLQSLEL